MAQKPGQVAPFLRRRPLSGLAQITCSCYVLFHRDTAEGIGADMSKLDFWAVVAVTTQLTLAAVVQFTVLS